MKTLRLEFLAILLLVSCYPEEKFFEAPGKVRKINVYDEKFGNQTDKYFYYNQLGDLVKETWKGQGQEKGMDILYSYNSNGQMIRKQSKIEGNQYTDDYTYDDSGRLINRSLGYDYFYDEQGRLSKISYYNRRVNGEKNILRNWVYTYDSLFHDRVVEEIQDWDGGISEHLVYIYNEEGLIIQKKLIDGRPHYLRETKEFFQYHADGRLYKMLVYNLDQVFYPGLDATHTYYYYE